MRSKIAFVILEHEVSDYFLELVRSVRELCPGCDVVWYNSGHEQATPAEVVQIPGSRPLDYAKVTPFYFDMFEWAATEEYDHLVCLETDMVFVRRGFDAFVREAMADADYLAPRLRRSTLSRSQWPPRRSLQAEIPDLMALLGTARINRCFSPGQVFSRTYIEALLSSGAYPAIRQFVEWNQQPGRSDTLQEVLLPTLADWLGLRARSYPASGSIFNRYRPYQGRPDLEDVRNHSDVYFIHPVRRSRDDYVRRMARQLVETSR
jgi:hypothetical protein